MDDRIVDWDTRYNAPRHVQNQERMLSIEKAVEKIADKMDATATVITGWQAVVADRQGQKTAKRDWLSPLLSATLGPLIVTVILWLFLHR